MRSKGSRCHARSAQGAKTREPIRRTGSRDAQVITGDRSEGRF
jgi:hypothetical protein